MTYDIKWRYSQHTKSNRKISGLDGVVTRVEFQIVVKDPAWKAPAVKDGAAPTPQQPVYILTSSRDLPAPDPDKFVAEDDLKGAALLAWAKESLGAEACLLYEKDAVMAYEAAHLTTPPTETVRLED